MTETRTSLLRWIVDEPASNAAWHEFFATYDPLLQSYVRKRARQRGLRWDDDEIDEVCQSIRLKLYAALPKFRLQHEFGRFRTWLYRVTTNVMIDRARSSLRRQARGKTLDEGQVDFDLVRDTSSDEPDDDWIGMYGGAVLQAALAEVRGQIEPRNPNKWASFELHTLQGKKAAEAAAELGINANLVYQNALRVYRDVAQLCLLKYEESLEHDGAVS